MSKADEARIRNELLQRLYAGILRSRVAALQTPHSNAAATQTLSQALAAAVYLNLQPGDLLLLPARRSHAFRCLLGLQPQAGATTALRDLAAGVVTQPPTEAGAVAQALGAAAQAAHAGQAALVCAVASPFAGAAARSGARLPKPLASWPEDWAGAAQYAARLALPLILLTDTKTAKADRAAAAPELHPAPLYPSIPADREDALALYRVAFECMARARTGGGPSHILSVGCRIAPGGDALGRLEAMLRQRSAFTRAWHRGLERQLHAELAL